MKKISIVECPEQRVAHGDFACSRKRLGDAAGAQKIGCSWMELAPGKKAFPFHFHTANEEAVFVLEGEGVLRSGEEEVPIRAGDYVAFPVGPPGHQIVNRSPGILRYLALSTRIDPEVTVYPDSSKVGTWSEMVPGGRAIYRLGSGVDYYEGEE
jgi:uncharacterized cupin superfamily protein